MKARQTRKLQSRRGASAMPSRQHKQQKPRPWLTVFKRLPWAKLALHGSIFCFWMIVLTGLSYGLGWLDRPISRIEVAGEMDNIRKPDVESVLAANLHQSFFTVDLDGIRTQLEAQPWVRLAAVSRTWPDTLAVQLVEQKAVGLWNDNGLINADGHVFYPRDLSRQQDLPLLRGPADKAEEVFSHYLVWQQKLQGQGLTIARIEMESRGAWRIGFAEGWELNLGKQDVDARLERFTTLFRKKLKNERARIAAVDARYTRGVAVTWKQQDALPESS